MVVLGIALVGVALVLLAVSLVTAGTAWLHATVACLLAAQGVLLAERARGRRDPVIAPGTRHAPQPTPAAPSARDAAVHVMTGTSVATPPDDDHATPAAAVARLGGGLASPNGTPAPPSPSPPATATNGPTADEGTAVGTDAGPAVGFARAHEDVAADGEPDDPDGEDVAVAARPVAAEGTRAADGDPAGATPAAAGDAVIEPPAATDDAAGARPVPEVDVDSCDSPPPPSREDAPETVGAAVDVIDGPSADGAGQVVEEPRSEDEHGAEERVVVRARRSGLQPVARRAEGRVAPLTAQQVVVRRRRLDLSADSSVVRPVRAAADLDDRTSDTARAARRRREALRRASAARRSARQPSAAQATATPRSGPRRPRPSASRATGVPAAVLAARARRRAAERLRTDGSVGAAG